MSEGMNDKEIYNIDWAIHSFFFLKNNVTNMIVNWVEGYSLIIPVLKELSFYRFFLFVYLFFIHVLYLKFLMCFFFFWLMLSNIFLNSPSKSSCFKGYLVPHWVDIPLFNHFLNMPNNLFLTFCYYR